MCPPSLHEKENQPRSPLADYILQDSTQVNVLAMAVKRITSGNGCLLGSHVSKIIDPKATDSSAKLISINAQCPQSRQANMYSHEERLQHHGLGSRPPDGVKTHHS